MLGDRAVGDAEDAAEVTANRLPVTGRHPLPGGEQVLD
jgi:hypothetical protein